MRLTASCRSEGDGPLPLVAALRLLPLARRRFAWGGCILFPGDRDLCAHFCNPWLDICSLRYS